MCEMLVRTQDKAPLDTPEAQARVSQRGDVIEICDDGWNWTYAELTNPFWTIVKIPGVPAEKMAAYISIEPGDPKLNPYLRRRLFKFDLDTFDPAITTVARKDSAVKLDQQSALALKAQKPVIVDPAVIGDAMPSSVIG